MLAIVPEGVNQARKGRIIRQAVATALLGVGIVYPSMVLELRADATYLWEGDDPRFRGTFTISDEDFEARSFTSASVTSHLFEFIDPDQPELSVSLSDPRNVHQNNFQGRITTDGQHLRVDPNPSDAVSYWVASWEYPFISVGLYSWSENDETVERFTYWNSSSGGVVGETVGTWSLVPEPTALTLLGLGSLALVVLRRKG